MLQGFHLYRPKNPPEAFQKHVPKSHESPGQSSGVARGHVQTPVHNTNGPAGPVTVSVLVSVSVSSFSLIRGLNSASSGDAHKALRWEIWLDSVLNLPRPLPNKASGGTTVCLYSKKRCLLVSRLPP